MTPPIFLHSPSGKEVHSSSPARTARYRRSAYFSELPPTATDNHSQSSTSSPDSSDEAAESPSVPHGSVQDILEWAGSNPARRQAALQAERQGKNRVTLIRALSD